MRMFFSIRVENSHLIRIHSVFQKKDKSMFRGTSVKIRKVHQQNNDIWLEGEMRTGIIQASMSKIQGLFKDFLRPLQQFSRT